MRWVLLVAFLAVGVIALPPITLAQTKTLASLIGEGYELKAMVVLGQAGFWLQKQNKAYICFSPSPLGKDPIEMGLLAGKTACSEVREK
jgi:hypothetical protein